jgi:hypothetical protein
VFDEKIDFSGARLLVFSTLRSILTLLTFGLGYSPLALVILLVMMMNTAQFQHIIQSHFDSLHKISDPKQKEILLERYRVKLGEDCKGMWKIFGKYVDVLLSCAGCFTAFYLYDTSSGSNTIAQLAFLVPLSYTLGKIIWRRVHPKSYATVSHILTKRVSHRLENVIELHRFSTSDEILYPDTVRTSEVDMDYSTTNPIISGRM